MEALTFDRLPHAVYELSLKVDGLTALLLAKSQPEPDRWFDVSELCSYLPDRPSPTTIYSWVQANAIPHGRNGKKLIFLKSEVDAWLKSKSRKSQAQINAEVGKHLSDQVPASRRPRQNSAAR